MHNFEEMDRRGTEDVLGHDEINHDKIDLNENPHIVLSKVRANNANRPILGHFKIDILLVTAWPTINIRPRIMHFRRLVFSYTE